jgi:dephospho-CoA kinase
MPARPFVVGLSGGIGSGKSTVADRFQALGAGVVDTDALAHQITAAGGAAIAPIRARFGERYLNADGSLNREAMRSLVFADAEAKTALERITHPLIGALARSSVLGRPEPYLLLVVPLLFETGAYPDLIDRVLIVDCPEDVQVERVMRRSGLSEREVRAIMATQLSRQARLARADDVIDNGQTAAALEAQVLELDARYRRLAAERSALDGRRK